MIDQYMQAFQEEAGELLSELESALLELEKNPAGEELVGRIFRALHTIKGSSSMFGFDVISSFTHNIETVFDEVRAGALPVSSELIALTLQSGDLIKAMLIFPAGQNAEVDADARRLSESLREFAGLAAPPLKPLHSDLAPSEECSITCGVATYSICYRPGRETFRNGGNPLHLLNELSQMGECRITARTEEIPTLDELDPTLCYLYWEILLSAVDGIDAIRDVFIFADEGEVAIEAVEEVTGEGASAGNPGAVAEEQAPLCHEPHKFRDPAGELKGAGSISSMRVSADKLDSLINLVGELVTVQARLSRTAACRNDAELSSLAEEVERLTGDLRENALSIRMLPIGSTFSRFGRVVHDVALELGKEVELVTSGGETELDKTVLEMLNDPLVHLIRNCIDHGIEPTQVREAAGKRRQGIVHLCAQHSGDTVVITVRDDGGGIDREAVRARGVEKGLVAATAELPDKELFSLIFAPGFSTAREVTSISGRGVGMDVVKRGVDALRGSISISSVSGEGSEVIIRIPLTLAIIETLLVGIGPDCYLLPLSLVEECLELTGGDGARAHGRHLISVRDQIVPYIRLRDRFGVCGHPPEIEQVVVTEVDGKRVGLVVDHVIGGHQTVIKSLGSVFREVEGVSGATILGDGRVALILDVPRLVEGEEVAGCAA